MATREPHRPSHLSEIAKACLQAVAEAGLGQLISIGGGVGLLHYHDYRPTHDVDAWWQPSTTSAQQTQLLTIIEKTLREFGAVRRREWGDVISLELIRENRTAFSFQIAHRSTQLETAVPAPWTAIWLDSFADLVASKMVALVERGAPRDFRDIYVICQENLISPADCWALWRKRQRLSGSDTDIDRATLAIETHLARIARHRPLERISDEEQRAAAAAVRNWFQQEFLDAAR